MASPDDIRATIESYAACMTAGDREGWLDLFAADATLEDPVGTDVRTGRDEIGEFWDFTRSLSSSIEMRLTGPVKVVAGEGAFAFLVISAVGDSQLAADIIDAMTFDDEAKITGMRAYWDFADMRPYP